MAIALTLQKYLDAQGVSYDLLEHKPTGCSAQTADAGHVPGECVAKGVVIRHRDGYVLCRGPASRQVRLEEVGHRLQKPVALASEEQIRGLFPDCELGAVPPLGAPYGLTAVVDAGLDEQPDIYFEGGDHRALVHVTGTQFRRLMETAPHGQSSA